VRDGVDPLAERKRDKLIAQFNAANTFGDIAKEYIDKMVRDGRADTTTTKANWLLEQLQPITTVAIVELKPATCWPRSSASRRRASTKLPAGAVPFRAECFDTR
jgi:hypothetical protein